MKPIFNDTSGTYRGGKQARFRCRGCTNFVLTVRYKTKSKMFEVSEYTNPKTGEVNTDTEHYNINPETLRHSDCVHGPVAQTKKRIKRDPLMKALATKPNTHNNQTRIPGATIATVIGTVSDNMLHASEDVIKKVLYHKN